jgi:predicted P-loop ATPase
MKKVNVIDIFNTHYTMTMVDKLIGEPDKTKYLELFKNTVKLNGKTYITGFEFLRDVKFSWMDRDGKPETPVNRRSSWGATLKFISELPDVKAKVLTEQYGPGKEWIGELDLGEKGDIKPTPENLLKIFEKDKKLHGLLFNELSGKREYPEGFLGRKKSGTWEDADESDLRIYLRTIYGLKCRDDITDVLNVIFRDNSYHPVQQYLNDLEWDGIERVERIFINYLGAEDTEYTRKVTRRKMIATVARAQKPGSQHDECLVLTGDQGMGKSSFLRRLAKKTEWYTEDLKNIGDKDSIMEAQRWIVSFDELDALRRSEATTLKTFMSKTVDNLREPYQRYVVSRPRTCSFFGTTNSRSDIITDPSGGRRFWILDCAKSRATKDVFTELELEADQIWAEAMFYYMAGEQWHLTPEEEALAKVVQDRYKQDLPWQGEITEFLDRKLPDNWDKLTRPEKKLYLQTKRQEDINCTTVRQCICAPEIYMECVNLDGNGKFDQLQAKEIGKVMNYLPGWKKASGTKRFGEYGPQRYWERV